jgi:hypothetical protein
MDIHLNFFALWPIMVKGTMPTEAKRKERIAVLHQEMDSLHRANNLYWQQTLRSDSDETKAGFYQRQDRLEELRSELDALRKWRP